MAAKLRRVHFSGYAERVPSMVDGTACRPDGQFERELLATSDREAVTCLACLRVTS